MKLFISVLIISILFGCAENSDSALSVENKYTFDKLEELEGHILVLIDQFDQVYRYYKFYKDSRCISVLVKNDFIDEANLAGWSEVRDKSNRVIISSGFRSFELHFKLSNDKYHLDSLTIPRHKAQIITMDDIANPKIKKLFDLDLESAKKEYHLK